MIKNIKSTDEGTKYEVDVIVNKQKYNAEILIDDTGFIEVHDIYLLVNGPLTTECVELKFNSNIYNQVYSYVIEYIAEHLDEILELEV